MRSRISALFVDNEIIERCDPVKSAALIEGQRARIEVRRRNPQILRLRRPRFAFEPIERHASDAATLKDREDAEKLQIRTAQPVPAHADSAGEFVIDDDFETRRIALVSSEIRRQRRRRVSVPRPGIDRGKRRAELFRARRCHLSNLTFGT